MLTDGRQPPNDHRVVHTDRLLLHGDGIGSGGNWRSRKNAHCLPLTDKTVKPTAGFNPSKDVKDLVRVAGT